MKCSDRRLLFVKISHRGVIKYLSNKWYKIEANNRVNIINYCRTRESMKFIKNHNYKFNSEELSLIEDLFTHSLYKKILLLK